MTVSTMSKLYWLKATISDSKKQMNVLEYRRSEEVQNKGTVLMRFVLGL